MLCTGHPDLQLWHVRSRRNTLKYNVHYRGKNSIAGSQEDIFEDGYYRINKKLESTQFHPSELNGLGLQQIIDKIDYENHRQRFSLSISRVCPQCMSNFSRLRKLQHWITHFYGQNASKTHFGGNNEMLQEKYVIQAAQNMRILYFNALV